MSGPPGAAPVPANDRPVPAHDSPAPAHDRPVPAARLDLAALRAQVAGPARRERRWLTGATRGRPARHRHRRSGRAGRAAARPALALLGLGLLVVGMRAPAAPAGHSGCTATPGNGGWPAVLASLDARRAAALAGDGPLTGADAPGSPALAADRDRLAALQRAGLRPPAVTPRLLAVVPLAATAGQVRLRVTDELGGYRLAGPPGAAGLAVPGRGLRTFVVQLRRTGAGWRVGEVLAVPPDQAASAACSAPGSAGWAKR